jgi:hypothetical protein
MTQEPVVSSTKYNSKNGKIYLDLKKTFSGKDLKLILSDYSLGITPEELVEIHGEATKEPLSFLKIDINTPNKDKKFSQGFTDFF